MSTPAADMIRIKLPSEWPDDDRKRWFSSCSVSPASFLMKLKKSTQDGVLDSNKQAVTYEHTTRVNLIEAWGQYLQHLSDSGCLNPNEPTEARAMPDLIFAYLKKLEELGRAPQTIGGRASAVSMFLSVTCPSIDTTDLRKIAWMFKQAAPMGSKSGRVVTPTLLIDLGIKLISDAALQPAEETPSTDQAIRFRDGLMIALLAQRPIRRENFSCLQIGSSFTKGPGGYAIHLKAEQVKTDCAIDVPCPIALTATLDRYLSIYRPTLLKASPTDALWVSSDTGRQLMPMGIYQAVCKRTRQEFGFHVNPHLFRDCAATFMHQQSPELAWMIAGLLGHSNLATARKYYIQGQSKASHDRYQDLVSGLRTTDLRLA